MALYRRRPIQGPIVVVGEPTEFVDQIGSVRMLTAPPVQTDADESGSGNGDQNGSAAASDSATVSARTGPWVTALLFVVIGVWSGWRLWETNPGGVRFEPLDGIAAFAIFYVIAQGIERLIEFLLPVAEALGTKFWGSTEPDAADVCEPDDDKGYASVASLKHRRDQAVALVDSDPAEDPRCAADAQQRLDQKRADRGVVMFGISAMLGMVAVGYIRADLLTAIGVKEAAPMVAVLVSGLAVSGGTKALHDLIGNVQKAKNAKEDPPETGGSAGG